VRATRRYRLGVTALAEAADDDYCHLTTRGRVSGDPHEIEIWFALDGTTLFMLAGSREGADWVRNLQAQPAVTVRVRDTVHEATARVVTDPDEARRARTLVFEKYEPRNPGLAGWRESALPVAVDVTP
jgi:deazaflavin-dependent oxidoreductase (nitroreductase family)